jgi:hypothetical protein
MRRWRKSISAARAEHDLFGKSVSTLGSSPRAGFFQIILWRYQRCAKISAWRRAAVCRGQLFLAPWKIQL